MNYLPQDKIFTADKRQYGKLELKERARGMRRQPTAGEEALWQALRGGQTGTKFRRQHSIDRYIVDFVAISAKLVVEVDGGIHDTQEQQAYDQGRSAFLIELGYRVVRFSNEQVLTNLPQVVDEVKLLLAKNQ